MNFPRINRGVFNYLKNRGCDIHEIRGILTKYSEEVFNISRPKKKRLEWYKNTSEEINKDFEAFKKYVKKNVKYKAIEDIECTWQESNLNGDFAYNGVTEDF